MKCIINKDILVHDMNHHFINNLNNGMSDPVMVNLHFVKTAASIISNTDVDIQSIIRLSNFCSSRVQALFNLPVFDAVVSKQKA